MQQVVSVVNRVAFHFYPTKYFTFNQIEKEEEEEQVDEFLADLDVQEEKEEEEKEGRSSGFSTDDEILRDFYERYKNWDEE